MEREKKSAFGNILASNQAQPIYLDEMVH